MSSVFLPGNPVPVTNGNLSARLGRFLRVSLTRLVSGRAIIYYPDDALTLSRLSPEEFHGGFVVGRRCAFYLRVCIQFPNGISIRMGAVGVLGKEKKITVPCKPNTLISTFEKVETFVLSRPISSRFISEIFVQISRDRGAAIYSINSTNFAWYVEMLGKEKKSQFCKSRTRLFLPSKIRKRSFSLVSFHISEIFVRISRDREPR